MTAQESTAALGGQWHGSYGTGCCPAHDDKHPSLSIRDSDDGKVLVHCHAGCAQDDVVAELKDQGMGRIGVPAIQSGSAADAMVGNRVVVAGHGGRRHALLAQINSKHEFAGYWEYVLNEAIFTALARPMWGGAALISDDGELLGSGSLLIQERLADDTTADNNMFVPIDLFAPILDDLMKFGKVDRPPRPWLGLFTTESHGQLVADGLTEGAPAHAAGLQAGDVVVKVADTPVTNLVDLFRRIWAVGPAGSVIPLTIERDRGVLTIEVT